MYDKEYSTIDDTDYNTPEPLEFKDLKPNNSTSKPLSAKNSAKQQTERILDATLDTLAKENAALIEENHILRNHLLLVKENAALRVANVIGELLKWFNAQCKDTTIDQQFTESVKQTIEGAFGKTSYEEQQSTAGPAHGTVTQDRSHSRNKYSPSPQAQGVAKHQDAGSHQAPSLNLGTPYGASTPINITHSGPQSSAHQAAFSNTFNKLRFNPEEHHQSPFFKPVKDHPDRPSPASYNTTRQNSTERNSAAESMYKDDVYKGNPDNYPLQDMHQLARGTDMSPENQLITRTEKTEWNESYATHMTPPVTKARAKRREEHNQPKEPSAPPLYDHDTHSFDQGTRQIHQSGNGSAIQHGGGSSEYYDGRDHAAMSSGFMYANAEGTSHGPNISQNQEHGHSPYGSVKKRGSHMETMGTEYESQVTEHNGHRDRRYQTEEENMEPSYSNNGSYLNTVQSRSKQDNYQPQAPNEMQNQVPIMMKNSPTPRRSDNNRTNHASFDDEDTRVSRMEPRSTSPYKQSMVNDSPETGRRVIQSRQLKADDSYENINMVTPTPMEQQSHGHVWEGSAMSGQSSPPRNTSLSRGNSQNRSFDRVNSLNESSQPSGENSQVQGSGQAPRNMSLSRGNSQNRSIERMNSFNESSQFSRKEDTNPPNEHRPVMPPRNTSLPRGNSQNRSLERINSFNESNQSSGKNQTITQNGQGSDMHTSSKVEKGSEKRSSHKSERRHHENTTTSRNTSPTQYKTRSGEHHSEHHGESKTHERPMKALEKYEEMIRRKSQEYQQNGRESPLKSQEHQAHGRESPLKSNLKKTSHHRHKDIPIPIQNHAEFENNSNSSNKAVLSAHKDIHRAHPPLLGIKHSISHTKRSHHATFSTETYDEIVLKPTTRLIGEIAFELDRMILQYVFWKDRHDTHKRLYGYMVKNIPAKIVQEAYDPITREVDEDKRYQLEYRYQYVLNSLKPLGYDLDFHPDFCINLVNTYGLLPLPADRERNAGIMPEQKDILKDAISRMANPEDTPDIYVLIDCLALLAKDSDKALIAV